MHDHDISNHQKLLSGHLLVSLKVKSVLCADQVSQPSNRAPLGDGRCWSKMTDSDLQ